ncbi:hypothetical protein CerSpe_293110 [Prunus speciosa]
MKELLRSFTRLGSVRGYSAGRKDLRIKGVKHTIAVASGKGGVGKSTTAVNLAVALANKCQMKVGLLDADVYGPNVPIMMKLDKMPEVNEVHLWALQNTSPLNKYHSASQHGHLKSDVILIVKQTSNKKMVPIESYGVKCMSMGLLVAKDASLVWRGPMVSSALEQMTRGVDWGNLDVLVVDMPPGTGDAHITVSQRLQLSGALIVSTPQDVALMDARRGINMFSKVEVPILGIVENMSCFKCPNCAERWFIFGEGGSRKTAAEMGVDFAGEIPLEVGIRQGSDDGVPMVISAPDSDVSKAYVDIAQKVVDRLEELAKEEQSRPQFNL